MYWGTGLNISVKITLIISHNVQFSEKSPGIKHKYIVLKCFDAFVLFVCGSCVIESLLYTRGRPSPKNNLANIYGANYI